MRKTNARNDSDNTTRNKQRRNATSDSARPNIGASPTSPSTIGRTTEQSNYVGRNDSSAEPINSAIAEPTADNTDNRDRTGDRGRTGRIGIDRTTGIGATERTRTATSGSEENTLVNGLDVEITPEPLPKLKRKYTRKAKTETSQAQNDLVRLAIVTALNTVTQTIFNGVAIIAKDKKWKLHQDESIQLANDIDASLALLPEGQYEFIIKYIATISPLASLATTIAGIIKSRLETNTPNTVAEPPKAPVTTTSTKSSEVIDGSWRFNPAFNVGSVGN